MADAVPGDGLPLGLDWTHALLPNDGHGRRYGYRPASAIARYWWPLLFLPMIIVVRSGAGPDDPLITRYVDFALGMLAASCYWFIRWSAAEQSFRYLLDLALASRRQIDPSQAGDLEPNEVAELRDIADDLGALAKRLQKIEKRLDYDHSDYSMGVVHRTRGLTDLERSLSDTRRTIERAAQAVDMPATSQAAASGL